MKDKNNEIIMLHADLKSIEKSLKDFYKVRDMIEIHNKLVDHRKNLESSVENAISNIIDGQFDNNIDKDDLKQKFPEIIVKLFNDYNIRSAFLDIYVKGIQGTDWYRDYDKVEYINKSIEQIYADTKNEIKEQNLQHVSCEHYLEDSNSLKRILNIMYKVFENQKLETKDSKSINSTIKDLEKQKENLEEKLRNL